MMDRHLGWVDQLRRNLFRSIMSLLPDRSNPLEIINGIASFSDDLVTLYLRIFFQEKRKKYYIGIYF